MKTPVDLNRIGVLTSGGDAPGMNAAIRAVVRMGLAQGWEVMGIRRGYAGLLDGDMTPLGARDVGGIIQRGGTILGSSRSLEFKTLEGQQRAIELLDRHGIKALAIIGGNGSQCGANALSLLGYPVVGIGSTIDNDLFGADVSIGVDTALNIALDAIDRLKVTASSHRRAFLIEVMGREFGYLALMAGLAGGAEVIIIPEVETDPEAVAWQLRLAYERGKPHAIIVVAEGAYYNADRLGHYFTEHRERLGFELRLTVLGHVQRGGVPGATDRLMGTRLGVEAVRWLARGEHGVLLGMNGAEVRATPLSEVAANKKSLDSGLLELARVLSK
ncbi:MAG: 6-phosphofructokinase [Chloroflexi bacterium]|nr:6-phosphofructokinase [Chloroflexota bacterium]